MHLRLPPNRGDLMELRIYFMSGSRITFTIQENEWPALRYELAGTPEVDRIEIRDNGMYVWSALDREELEVA
jgi:hypothetical protein